MSKLLLPLLLMLTTGQAGAQIQSLVYDLGQGVSLEINPQVEFLSALQWQTSWIRPGQGGAPDRPLGPYQKKLQEVSQGWKNSEAAALTQELLNSGFSYDAPMNFALACGPGFSPPSQPWSDYLQSRAGGGQRLDQLRTALEKLFTSSGFIEVWNTNREYYQNLLKGKSEGLRAAEIVGWLHRWFANSSKNRYHFVLAPGQFPQGGYGATHLRPDGSRDIFQVVRVPEQITVSDLEGLSLHEFGHAFVNPAIGDSLTPEQQRGLYPLFLPVKDRMEKMAYGQLSTFLNELVLRAAEVRGGLALGLQSNSEVPLAKEEYTGFYPIRTVYELLLVYENSRDKYPNFSDFAPVILNTLSEKAQEIAATAPDLTPRNRFITGFEEGEPRLLPGWGAFMGRGASVFETSFYDQTTPASGSNSFTVKVDKGTSVWRIHRIPLEVRSGVLKANWKVRTRGITPDGAPYKNAWIGILIEGADGQWQVRAKNYEGTRDWTTDSISTGITPSRVRSVSFGVFLTMPGELSLDDVAVTYE